MIMVPNLQANHFIGSVKSTKLAVTFNKTTIKLLKKFVSSSKRD